MFHFIAYLSTIRGWSSVYIIVTVIVKTRPRGGDARENPIFETLWHFEYGINKAKNNKYWCIYY